MSNGFKSRLKSALPESVRRLLESGAKSKFERARWNSLIHKWNETRRETIRADRATPPRKVLILPSDPSAIVGAVGDDAMISVTVDKFRQRNHNVQCFMLCRPGAAEKVASTLGFVPVALPDEGNFPAEFLEIIQDDYDAFVVLGADIMDGYYYAPFAACAIIASDLAARSGLETIVLGFSFNRSPARALALMFDRIDPAVHLNLRDSVSFDRFRSFTTAKAQLVADSAFNLQPGAVSATVESWIKDAHTRGHIVLGLNIHPMLFKDASQENIEMMIARTAYAIRKISLQNDVSWLIIPHDYRASDGDGVILRPLHEMLRAELGENVCYLEGQHRASDLKATAGMLDGIITGRMHLAIAALGMGVPTLCLIYQDKFEGLAKHFDLPSKLLLAPAALESEAFVEAIGSFSKDLPELRIVIERRLNQVLNLALSNFPRNLPTSTAAN